MSNTRKPAARKPSKAAEKKAQDALEDGLRLTIDGESYEVRIGDISSAVAREFRTATGHGISWLMEQIAASPDVDLIADFVWLARRMRGDQVAHSEVEVTYSQLLSDGFDIGTPEDGDGDPEA